MVLPPDEKVREGVRGVRRRTSLRLERPDPDVTTDSGVRRVDVIDLVCVRVGVVGPECESPRSEFDAELRKERVEGITRVPMIVVENGWVVVEVSNVALGELDDME